LPQRFILISALFVSISILDMLSPLKAPAEDLFRPGNILTLERCIEIAMSRHPALLGAAHARNAAEARLGQAKSDYYPRLNAGAGYQRTSADFAAEEDRYSGSLTLNQNLFDFGRTPALVRARNRDLSALRHEVENVSDQLAFNVKQAYYGLLKALRNREVAVETVLQFEKHREEARGFYETGMRPKFDLTRAEVELSNARLNLIRSENALKVARVTLNNAMGLEEAPEYAVEDTLSSQTYAVAFESAVARAYAGRADLRAAAARKKAAEALVDLAGTGHYPTISGNAGYDWFGEDFPLEEGWSFGAALSFPLFNGLGTHYSVREAQSNLKASEAEEALLKQNIFLELQQAFLNLVEAEETIAATELTVRQAEENLEIARGRYGAGIGSPIELADAGLVLTEARTAHVQSLYDYKIAQAAIERAMGLK
jgi:outer membrane protein TolC